MTGLMNNWYGVHNISCHKKITYGWVYVLRDNHEQYEMRPVPLLWLSYVVRMAAPRCLAFGAAHRCLVFVKNAVTNFTFWPTLIDRTVAKEQGYRLVQIKMDFNVQYSHSHDVKSRHANFTTFFGTLLDVATRQRNVITCLWPCIDS